MVVFIKNNSIYVLRVVCLCCCVLKKFIVIKSCLQPVWLENGEDFGRLSNCLIPLLIKNILFLIRRR